MSPTLLGIYIAFMSIVLLIYCLVPKKYKYIVILVFSVIFYALYSKFMTFFILATVISIYLAGILMNKQDAKYEIAKEGLEKEERKILKAKIKSKKKWILIGAVVLNLVILAGLKYFNFFGSIVGGFFDIIKVNVSIPILAIALPLGISYYTLQALGYLIDVYRGKYKGDTNFFRIALFIFYFPQLFEGPIGSYDALANQLYDGNDTNAKNVFRGLLLVLWGLIKKVIIADRLAIIVGEVFKNYAQYSGIIIVLGILLFTIQLYAEFSGFIDVAHGISEMFGIHLTENFKQPFFSHSVNEFWRKWHISLGAWFRDYIFYSISTSKGFAKMNKKLSGKINPFFATFIPTACALFMVWFCNGLWHGASWKYVVYGLYYYAIMMIGLLLAPLFSKMFKRLKINPESKLLRGMSMLRTFILVNIGMLIFRAPTLGSAWSMIASIFQPGASNLIGLGIIDIQDVVVMIIGIIVLVAVEIINAKGIRLRDKLASCSSVWKTLIIVGLILLLLVFGAFGNGYIPGDPIYGGF